MPVLMPVGSTVSPTSRNSNGNVHWFTQSPNCFKTADIQAAMSYQPTQNSGFKLFSLPSKQKDFKNCFPLMFIGIH